MKTFRNAIATLLLAVWMLVSISITGMVYAVIGVSAGRGVLYEMERALGGFSIDVIPGVCLNILWAQMLLCLPVLILLSIPAVWLLGRKGK